MSLPISVRTALQHQHEEINLIMEGLTEAQLRMAVNPGKWSVFENIVHLATYQYTFLQRIEIMLREDAPSFGRYVPEADPLFHDNLTLTTIAVLENLKEKRKMINDKIIFLPAGDFNRMGIHPLFGRMTILQWTEFFLLHEAHHLFTAFKLAAGLRKI